MIVILFTGGTITMRNDPGGGGAQPGLTASEILSATKGIRAITAVETEEWGQFPGPHMTVERMWALRNRIVEHLARPEVTGVVITHGTDTLEESAYLVARSTSSDKPIDEPRLLRSSRKKRECPGHEVGMKLEHRFSRWRYCRPSFDSS